MEKEISLKTADGHKIYGFLSLPEQKSDRLVIFVHGFTGNCNEHIFFNGANFFKSKGITTFRFDLYNWQKDGRSFTDCDLQTHIQDLRTVFDYFKSEYKKIYLVGHSFGGIVVLESKLDVSGIILWDSSHPASPFLEEGDDYKYNKLLDAYLLNWGVTYVVGRKMHESTQNLRSAANLISGNNLPIKIICTEKGVLLKGGTEYFDLAKEPKAFAIIKNAGHTFDEEGTEEDLFGETVEWIEEF